MKIEERSGLSGRNLALGAQAAELLELVTRANKKFTLTPAGRALAATKRGSEAERVALVEAFETSRGLQILAPQLLAHSAPSQRSIAKRLEKYGGIGEGTAGHRAGMLLQWRARLVQGEMEFSSGMWRKIEITNFRSIETASVIIAPFTVIVGPNGSGKSNFVDALVFMRDVATDAPSAVSARGGIVGIRRWSQKRPRDVEIDLRVAESEDALQTRYARHMLRLHSEKQSSWSFSQEEIEVTVEPDAPAKLTRKKDQFESSVSVSAVEPTSSAMVPAKQYKQFRATAPLHNVRRYRLNPDKMRAPELLSDSSRLVESGENIATAVYSLSKSDRKEAIIRPMSKIIRGLDDIYVIQVGRHLALKFKQLQGQDLADFDATEMSEGALRALGIVVATHQMTADELLIIEEPEVAIHAGAAALLFDLLKEASERGSVLITTHSADLLDAAGDEEILVCEYNAGITKIGPLSRTQREVVKEGLFSVSELMRSESLRIQPA